MVNIILVGAVALTTIVVPIAGAQTVGVGGELVGAGITLTPEEQAVIRSWILRQRPVVVREHVTVGATLPDGVESYPVPNDWGLSATHYRYLYSSNRVYFVEPSTRRVVQVFD